MFCLPLLSQPHLFFAFEPLRPRLFVFCLAIPYPYLINLTRNILIDPAKLIPPLQHLIDKWEPAQSITAYL